MTSQISSDLTDFQPATLGSAARPKRAPNPSLALGRAQRALRRQVVLFALAFLLVAGAGIAFDVQGGLRPLAAAAFWAPIGLGVALVLAVLAELARGAVTFPESLGKHSGYSVLGAAPELTERALRELAPDKRSPLGCVTFAHASPFAAAYRDLQATLRDDHLVAFIAPLAGEGATTTALCAAISATQQGRRVIVVDCDTRRRSLTKALGAADADKGVMECCEDPANWRSYVLEEAETGLPFLPAARMRNAWRTLVGAAGLREMIAALREEYDLVILDCPPALRSGDGPVLASLTDKCVAVAAWDQTPLAALRQTVRTLQHRGGVKAAIYVNRVLPGYRFQRQQ